MEKIHRYGLLAVAVYFALQWFTTHTLPGWGWLLTPTGLFVIAKQTLPFLLRPTYRATQPRLDDKFYADKDGLRFVTGGRETQIAWADITDSYSWTRSRMSRAGSWSSRASPSMLDTGAGAPELSAVRRLQPVMGGSRWSVSIGIGLRTTARRWWA